VSENEKGATTLLYSKTNLSCEAQAASSFVISASATPSADAGRDVMIDRLLGGDRLPGSLVRNMLRIISAVSIRMIPLNAGGCSRKAATGLAQLPQRRLTPAGALGAFNCWLKRRAPDRHAP
jgi:hypothetical protein